MVTIQVLLATHNGARFVREQVLSVLEQTFTDLEILVGDDGSTDETLQIIEQLAREFPGKVRILFRSRIGGAAGNFSRLIAVSDAAYVMFCDQDDIWLPEKTSLFIARCRVAEDANPDAPVLVHSDLTVVDSNLNEIASSFFAYKRINPNPKSLAELMVNSSVTGCATMINRPLAKLAIAEDPSLMIMHDWWISLLAMTFGTIETINNPTVLYRQHDSNTIGAMPPGNAVYFVRRVIAIARGGSLNRNLRRTFKQAKAFMSAHGAPLSTDSHREALQIAKLADLHGFKLRYQIIRLGLLKNGLLRDLLTLLVV